MDEEEELYRLMDEEDDFYMGDRDDEDDEDDEGDEGDNTPNHSPQNNSGCMLLLPLIALLMTLAIVLVM